MTNFAITAKMDTNAILAAGRADYTAGKKGALRSLVWFSYGFHQAHDLGT
jgi:hypothetical protein